MRGQPGDAAQQFGVRRGLLEGVEADHAREIAAPVGRAFADQLEQPGFGDILDRGEVGGDLFRRDVVEHDVEIVIGLDGACQQVQHPPLRLDRLEFGMVQDQPHRIGQRRVDRSLHRRNGRVGQRLHMRADHAGDQLVGRRGFARILGAHLAADQLLEIAQLAVGRHLVAAAGLLRRMHLLAEFLAPFLQLGRGAFLGLAGAEPPAQGHQPLEHLDLLEQFVGVQVVDAVEPHLDRRLALADRQHQRGGEAGNHVLDRIDVELDRPPLGQGIAGFQVAAGRPSREVAEQRHAKPAAVQLAAIGARLADAAEADRRGAKMCGECHGRPPLRSASS